MAKRHRTIRRKSSKKGCVSPSVGLRKNGRLKPGFRYAKSRKGCILRARKGKK